MLAEAEKGMPDGTAWTADLFYDYYTSCFPGYRQVGGCNSFAAALSDYIFGKDAPVTKHQDFDKLKVGDVIWLKDGAWGHVVVITDDYPTTIDSYMYTNGNNGGEVWWNRYGYINNWSQTQKAETYVYSRY